MFLRRFLWFLSLSVFLAGVVHYFAGNAGTSKGPAAGPRLEGRILVRTHRPDASLVSKVVGGATSFWYLTMADHAVTDEILSGPTLVSRAPGAEGPLGGAEAQMLSSRDAALAAEAALVRSGRAEGQAARGGSGKE
jgi:hypothetical protein